MRNTLDSVRVTHRRDSLVRTGGLRPLIFLATVVLLIGSALRAQTTLYWDINHNTAGAGGASPSATWATNGGNTNWNRTAGGNVTNTQVWTSGAFAVFSAGTDATGAYTVTVSGTQTTAGITVSEGSPTFSSGTLKFTGTTPTVSVAAGSTATFNSQIASTTGFTKSGTGMMLLGNAANAFTGTTNVSAGTLKLSVSGGLSGSSALNIAAAGTVDFDWGHSDTVASLAGAGTLDIKNGTLTVGDSTNTTFSGVLTDSGGYGSVIKQGTGTLTLSGANTFAGPVSINAGVLNLQNSSALGGSTYGNTVSNGAALQLQNNVTVAEGSFNLNGSGVGATGALRNVSGANTFTGAVILASSSTIGSDTGTLTVSGDVDLGSSHTLTLAGAGNLEFSGAVNGSASGITQTGIGITTFSGSTANSFGGPLNINSGTVQLNKTAGTNAVGGGAVTIGDGVGAANSATLTLLASNQLPDSSGLLTINSDGRFNVNNQTETLDLIGGTGVIDLGATGRLTLGINGGSSVFGGTIAGTGTLEKLGAGTLTFSSNLTFAGTFLLGGGTLALNGFNLSFGTLHITGNSILDFGNTVASTLTATNVIVDSGVILTITNWVNLQDFFYASNSFQLSSGGTLTNATPDTRGAAPQNQVIFSGFTGANTTWQSWDHQITPAPEPAVYGAVFVSLMAAVVIWRRRAVSAQAA